MTDTNLGSNFIYFNIVNECEVRTERRCVPLYTSWLYKQRRYVPSYTSWLYKRDMLLDLNLTEG